MTSIKTGLLATTLFAAATRSVEIRMTDKMRFMPDRLDFKQGETLRLLIRNQGAMPGCVRPVRPSMPSGRRWSRRPPALNGRVA